MTIQALGAQSLAALTQSSAPKPAASPSDPSTDPTQLFGIPTGQDQTAVTGPAGAGGGGGHHHHHHGSPPPSTDPGTSASDPQQTLDSLASALGTDPSDLLAQLSSGGDTSSLFGQAGAATWNQQSTSAASGLAVDQYA